MYDEKDYPFLLRQTTNAPFILFYRGNINALKKKTVSVVGTRLVSPEAKKAAEPSAAFYNLLIFSNIYC